MFSGLVSGFAYQAPALPQFLPEPGVLAVKVGVQVEVLLEVLLHVLLGRQLPPHNNDHSLGFVMQCLCIMCCSKLQFCPHGFYIRLAQDDDRPSAGLHGVDDLVRDHLPHVQVPGVDQALVLEVWVVRRLKTRAEFSPQNLHHCVNQSCKLETSIKI